MIGEVGTSGVLMALVCNRCGAALLVNARFCSKCGTQIPVSAPLPVRPPLITGQEHRKVHKSGPSSSVTSWLSRLRAQIDPNRTERIKANNLLLKARYLRLDAGEAFKEAYRVYLKGKSEEALKLFVSAAEIESRATRLEKEAEEIFVGIGRRVDPSDHF